MFQLEAGGSGHVQQMQLGGGVPLHRPIARKPRVCEAEPPFGVCTSHGSRAASAHLAGFSQKTIVHHKRPHTPEGVTKIDEGFRGLHFGSRHDRYQSSAVLRSFDIGKGEVDHTEQQLKCLLRVGKFKEARALADSFLVGMNCDDLDASFEDSTKEVREKKCSYVDAMDKLAGAHIRWGWKVLERAKREGSECYIAMGMPGLEADAHMLQAFEIMSNLNVNLCDLSEHTDHLEAIVRYFAETGKEHRAEEVFAKLNEFSSAYMSINCSLGSLAEMYAKKGGVRKTFENLIRLIDAAKEESVIDHVSVNEYALGILHTLLECLIRSCDPTDPTTLSAKLRELLTVEQPPHWAEYIPLAFGHVIRFTGVPFNADSFDELDQQLGQLYVSARVLLGYDFVVDEFGERGGKEECVPVKVDLFEPTVSYPCTYEELMEICLDLKYFKNVSVFAEKYLTTIPEIDLAGDFSSNQGEIQKKKRYYVSIMDSLVEELLEAAQIALQEGNTGLASELIEAAGVEAQKMNDGWSDQPLQAERLREIDQMQKRLSSKRPRRVE